MNIQNLDICINNIDNVYTYIDDTKIETELLKSIIKKSNINDIFILNDKKYIINNTVKDIFASF